MMVHDRFQVSMTINIYLQGRTKNVLHSKMYCYIMFNQNENYKHVIHNICVVILIAMHLGKITCIYNNLYLINIYYCFFL